MVKHAISSRISAVQQVIIARKRAVALLQPIGAPPGRQFGIMEFHIPDQFFDPLPEDELALWE